MNKVYVILICQATLLYAAKLDHLVRAPSQRSRSNNNGYNYEPPQQQGYNYNPPPKPAGLYELPSNVPTSTIPPPPPPPPSGLYELPPSPQASSNEPQLAERPQVDVPMMAAMPYEFNYAVDDEETQNKHSRTESQDGNVLRGEYRVLLPDGRTQVVTYFDDGNGFNAEVTYV